MYPIALPFKQHYHSSGDPQAPGGREYSICCRERRGDRMLICSSHLKIGTSSKNLETINAGEGVEEREHSCTVGGNVN